MAVELRQHRDLISIKACLKAEDFQRKLLPKLQYLADFASQSDEYLCPPQRARIRSYFMQMVATFTGNSLVKQKSQESSDQGNAITKLMEDLSDWNEGKSAFPSYCTSQFLLILGIIRYERLKL